MLGANLVDERHALAGERQTCPQLGHVERLEDHVGRPGDHDLGQRVVGRVPGDDQGKDVGLQAPGFPDHRQAVRVRHVHVGHQKIEVLGPEGDERLGRAGELTHLVPFPRAYPRKHAHHGFLIVEDENSH